jgi:transcriptional regulator with XRE-family HTH domain
MPIDPATLAHRVRSRRLGQHKRLREAAHDAGVSPATLSRVERGDYVPGRENLIKLADWLDLPVDQLMAGQPLVRHGGEPESTLESVALHLRADKKLSPDDAAILEQLFRSAYEALVKRKAKTSR